MSNEKQAKVKAGWWWAQLRHYGKEKYYEPEIVEVKASGSVYGSGVEEPDKVTDFHFIERIEMPRKGVKK